jgi:hypothetical protein
MIQKTEHQECREQRLFVAAAQSDQDGGIEHTKSSGRMAGETQ